MREENEPVPEVNTGNLIFTNASWEGSKTKYSGIPNPVGQFF
jgi:hypothetical protein